MKFDLISDEFGRIEYLPIPETDSEKAFCEEVNAIMGTAAMLFSWAEYKKNGLIDPPDLFRPYIDAWKRIDDDVSRMLSD